MQILEAAEMLKYCVTYRDKRQINVEIFVFEVLSFTLFTSLKNSNPVKCSNYCN